MNKITAPFSPDDVAALAASQEAPMNHQFTCPNRSMETHRHYYGDLGVLVPTVRGWICPYCDYTQDWAYDFMAGAK
jgi:hypothetical protein